MTTDATPYFFFVGFAVLIGTLIVAYLLYQYIRILRMLADKEEAYTDTEIVALDELLKRTKPLIWQHKKLIEIQNKKSFRKRLEEELVKDFFEDREKQKRLKE